MLFIDGGSRDRTREILAELAAADARVRVLDNPARRTPHALNIGLAAARGEFVARMDAHTFYPPRYLQDGIDLLRRGDVEWVAGAQLARGVDPGTRLVALAMSSRLGTGGASFRRESETEHDDDTGFTGVWRRETLDAHGGWDEEWVNDQDFELAARIRAAGGRIVCVPSMAAEYIPRGTLEGVARQYFRYGVFRVKTIRRHPQTMRRSHVLPPAVALTVAASALAPRPVRRLARVGSAAYATAVLVESARLRDEADRGQAARLPLVFGAMHLAYGAGFLWGCVRMGPPLAALAGLLRR